MYIGGIARLRDLSGFLNQLQTFTPETAEVFKGETQESLSELDNRDLAKQIDSVCRKFMTANEWGFFRNGVQVSKEDAEQEAKQETISRAEELLRFAERYEQETKVLVWEDRFAVLYIGNPNSAILVPTPSKYFDYIPPRQHDDISPAEFLAESGLLDSNVSALAPSTASGMTIRSAKKQLDEQEKAITALDKHYKSAERGESEELVELKRELERIQKELAEKKQALLEQLEAKKAEMLVQKAQMESQIFLLDSEIYNIECYMGETVSFARIRSGRNAPDTEPIVVHQKLRFLDEDLGRLASIYRIEWSDVGMFEEFLRHSPVALETFAPNERCVMLVRLSKTANRFTKASDLPYSNMLEKYEMFHGKTVGIVVRNGENVYLGWTDEDRVQITDDLVFSSSQIHTETVPDETPEFLFKSDRDKWLAKQIEDRKNILGGLVSRSFVFSILQGLVDRTGILPLPKGTKINKSSEYVQFSIADAWLSDNKYGSFRDLIRRCNENITRGDMILTMQALVAEQSRFDQYAPHNDRGRGYNDRTHDVSAEDCTLYPVNLVEFEKPVDMVRYRFPSLANKGEWMVCNAEAGATLSEKCEILERYTRQKRHVFISLPKTDSSWRRPYWASEPAREPRANFELYDEEYLNLTYMNSVWLEWVVTTKNLGGMVIGGQAVDYAHMIRYIKTALDFVRTRESLERAEIESVAQGFCSRNADWQVLVSEFKLEKKVREITSYQAKRFVKWASERLKTP